MRGSVSILDFKGSADWSDPHGLTWVPVLHAAMQRYHGLRFDVPSKKPDGLDRRALGKSWPQFI
jgi:hypothetical protein